jgi:DNA-binding CsgD family transcriptional regulator
MHMEKPRPSPPDPEHQAMAEEHISPGFLILSSSLKLLYRDHQSWKLCGLIHRMQQGTVATGVIPHAVLQVCTEVARLMQSTAHTTDLDELQIRHIISDRRTEILVLAIGLPDANDPAASEILVLLEEVSRPLVGLLRGAKRRFQLTDREVNVVQHLLKGMTNKEIANEMHVTEQTVKEHIKNIMKKTKTLTRTAILLAVSGMITPQPPDTQTAAH